MSRRPLFLGAAVLLSVLRTFDAPSESVAECPRSAALEEHPIQIAGRVFLGSSSGIVEMPGVTPYCLSCHDGTRANFVTHEAIPFVSPASAERGHPVDVSYPVSSPGFVTSFDLDPRLALTNGRVTCRTCHGDSSPQRTSLSVSNEGSALCLSCHRR
jgi:predicted CXXCH cytochrome family protein